MTLLVFLIMQHLKDMNVSHIKGYVFPGITFSLLKEGLVPRDKTLEQVQDQHTVNVKLGHASCWK